MSQTLRIDNNLNALSEMSDWVVGRCKALGFPRALSFRLDLVANEAVTNTISHGYQRGARGEIVLRLHAEEGNAMLEIEDDGIEFNPLRLAETPRPETLDESRVGGLGVLLIIKSMAHCEYQRRAGRNVLILKSPLA